MVQGLERRRQGTPRLETRVANPHGATPQWRNPQQASRRTRRQIEVILTSSGEQRSFRLDITRSANGAKAGHGTKITETGTADFTPVCHKTSPPTEMEGGERGSPNVQVTDRPDRPVNNVGWSHTAGSSVSDNLSPILHPNAWRKMIGGWREEKTDRHFLRMEYRGRTVCPHVLIHRTEDRCHLD